MAAPLPNDPQVKALLERKLELSLRKLQLVKEDGLSYYVPYECQDNFHAAGTNRYRLWEAGNRSGKSTAGVAEDAAFLMGKRAWYEKKFAVLNSSGKVVRYHDGYKEHPLATAGIPQGRPVKLLVITTDWDKVDEIFTSQRGEMGKLWRYLPRGMVKPNGTRRNHSGAIDTVELINGSIIRFDTVKSWLANPQGSESSDWDGIHIDEPCPHKMFIAVSRGLIDRGGSTWFTLTPLDQPWIHAKFFPTRNRNDAMVLTGQKWAQRSSTYENVYLSKANIAEYESTLTHDEIQCRIKGIPLSLTGLVYKEFDFNRHVLQDVPKGWSSYFNPPADWTIYVQIDVHLQLPQAVLFMAVGPRQEVVLYDEIWEPCLVSELAMRINSRLQGRFCVWVGIDPMAYNPDIITGRTVADDMALNGLYLSKGSKDKQRGILATKQLLNIPGKLYVNPHLERTISEFENYVYDKENRPADKDDHMMENLYRLVLCEPHWTSPESSTPVYDTDMIPKEEMSFNPDLLDL